MDARGCFIPMKIISLILLCVVSFIEPAFAQAQFPYTGRVTADRVFVRAGQHVNYETIAIVNKGDELVVLAKVYAWLKVKLPATATVFLKAEHVAFEGVDVGQIKVDKLNVRAAPNTEAAIIGKLDQGKRFYIRENKGEWLSIKPTDEMIGWVKEELLERTKKEVPARLYAEPFKTAVKPLPVMTPGFIKETSDGRVEITGTLLKQNDQFTVKGSGEIDVVVVQGPVAMLNGFVNKRVKVTGKNASTPPSDNMKHIDLLKINLSL
jgi:SH3-like domain-containing protein